MKLEKKLYHIPLIASYRKNSKIKLFSLYYSYSRLDFWAWASFAPLLVAFTIIWIFLKKEALLQVVITLAIILIAFLITHSLLKILHEILSFPPFPDEKSVAKQILQIKINEDSYFTLNELAQSLYGDLWKPLPTEEKNKSKTWAENVIQNLRGNERVKIEKNPFENDITVMLSP